jgi:prepilin signal peptidase PulO-like enzyme (type II secretory pathway)
VQTIDIIWFGFFTIMGASIGSFLNVVIYRLPAEKSLSKPGSHCPLCGHVLSWWENVPIFAWIYLGAKCSNCKAKISPQYVIIETLTAAIFAGFFWLYYLHAPHHGGSYAQLFFNLRAMETWPVFAMHMVLMADLAGFETFDDRFKLFEGFFEFSGFGLGFAHRVEVYRNVEGTSGEVIDLQESK